MTGRPDMLPAPPPAGRLAGRAVLVTGAAQGIGAAVARLFAAEGARLALLDIRRDGLDRVAAETGAIALECDLRDVARLKSVADEAARRLGHLDGLVNAAGIHAAGSVGETTPERWRDVMAVNLDAPFFLCRAAEPHLRAAAGSTIVNLSSAAARLGSPGEYVDYAASKGAIDTFTIGLAREVAAEGIRVNAVRPGIIDTEIHASGGQPDRVAAMRGLVPMRREGTAEEVARAILWLLSKDASYTTGAILNASGGR